MKAGDIVQYGCSKHVVLSVDQFGGGDYDHVTIKCIESNDDWLAIGDVNETFTGRVALLEEK